MTAETSKIIAWTLAAVATVAVVLTAAPRDADACSPALDYDLEILEDDTPACLTIGEDVPDHSPRLSIENECDEPVEFLPQDCEDCPEDPEPVVVESGGTESIYVASGDMEYDETRQYDWAWTKNSDEEGVVTTEVTLNGPVDGACDDWPPDTGGDDSDAGTTADAGDAGEGSTSASGGADGGCSSTGSSDPSPLSAALAVLFVTVFARRMQTRLEDIGY